MFKLYLLLLLVLLFFIVDGAIAQTGKNTYNHYLGTFIRSYSPPQFYTDKKFQTARQLPDSLDLQIQNADDLQPILTSGLQNRVYGVEIQNFARPDLAKIFNILAGFSNLVFIKISDPFFPDPKSAIYQLPANIQLLQQLQGIEFFYEEKLDMEDAINKVATLKHLNTISFAGYKHQLPLVAQKLTSVKFIKLSSVNIEDYDVSKTQWQSVILGGSAPIAGPDAKVLATLSTIKTLRELHLDYYMLGDGAALSKLNQINTLAFSSCYLDKPAQLFKKIAYLKRLTNLSVRYFTDSTQNVAGIENLTKLRYLDIALPSLANQPRQLIALIKLKNLEALSISSSKLPMLPDVFGNLKKLKKVSFRNNELAQLPPSLFALPALAYLDAGSNKLTMLPDDIGNIKTLKTLELNSNRLSTLPVTITKLVRLENLDLSYNKITSLNGNWQDLTKLKTVKLLRNRLTAYPTGLTQNHSVESVDVSDNNISSIGDITGAGYQLKTLNVNGNQLTLLPEHIGKYTELTDLYAEGNRLTALPGSLGDCKRIKLIDVHTQMRSFTYDPDKTGMASFGPIINDSTKINNIRSLPAGLMDARYLQTLNLADNPAINSKSVFDVVLSMPRKDLRLNLSGDNIRALPADQRWANMTFYDIDLSYNGLTTLPAEFAGINLLYQINLNHNNLGLEPFMFTNQAQNKADIKVLYDELGVKLPDNIVSGPAYAAALTKRINDFYYAKKWQKGVEYAQKAIVADAVVYTQNVRWDEIGTCRYMVKDYKGAIKDFDIYLDAEKKATLRIMNFINPVIQYKAQAHLALGQPVEAAKTYEFLGKNFHGNSALQEAAVIYKSAGYEERYQQLIDTALLVSKKILDENSKSKYVPTDLVLDYAELLIIAGKPTEATNLLNKQPSAAYVKTNAALKSYLTITAGYLNNEETFEGSKKLLTASIAANGKVTNWDFTMFNKWLSYSGLPATKQQELLALQNIVK